ncbi:coiled-coil domain-containing protein [Haemophilus parahaemolyticus]
MGFSLTQYDHVEKFTLLQAFEYLNKKEISTDIAMLLIFEKIFDLNKGNSKLSVYGQIEGGYRYDASIYEIENILNVYRWYRNPDNPQSFSREYTFDDEDIKTLNTYFFDKKEFCNFFDLSYKSEADEKFDELIENIPKLFEQYNESLKEIAKQIEEIEKLENENFEQAEEIALLKAENKQLRAMQAVNNGGNVAIIDCVNASIYGHTSELLSILFRVVKEFWANAETPPKNAHIEAWIEQEYPITRYPYVSKAVRQYIATIARPQSKLK